MQHSSLYVLSLKLKAGSLQKYTKQPFGAVLVAKLVKSSSLIVLRIFIIFRHGATFVKSHFLRLLEPLTYKAKSIKENNGFVMLPTWKLHVSDHPRAFDPKWKVITFLYTQHVRMDSHLLDSRAITLHTFCPLKLLDFSTTTIIFWRTTKTFSPKTSHLKWKMQKW